MSRRNQTMHHPLLLSGLPDDVVQWLRIAGIPFAPYRMSPSMLRQGRNAAGHILIFDARNASGRLDARTAQECGAQVINVADLLKNGDDFRQNDGPADVASTNTQQSVRGAFLEQLKLRFEAVGGFWLRLADFPFPYRNALCQTHNPGDDLPALADAFAMLVRQNSANTKPRHPDGDFALPLAVSFADDSGRRTSNAETKTWLRDCYASGLPLFVDVAQHRHLLENHSEIDVRDTDEFPLMWRTTTDEFARWWQMRTRLKVVGWKMGTTYQIQCKGDFAGFQPMMELWLGNHVASFPLFDENMTIREEGLVFVQEHRKHAGGFVAGWSGRHRFSSAIERFTHHSV
jgi:hypothetical protein